MLPDAGAGCIPAGVRNFFNHTGYSSDVAILEITGIKKSFGGLKVLDGIDLAVEEGTVCQLVGPNGCGKTTLINIITGLLESDGGKIVFDGQDLTKKGLLQSYQAGLIRTWQTPQPFVNLTSSENLMTASPDNPGESFIYALARGLWSGAERSILKRSRDVGGRLNLIKKSETLSGNLSGGQQKLLELGKTMMAGSKLILLDEPIAGVNPKLALEIFGNIRNMCKKHGITFLFVEHRLDISFQYTDKVFALNRGKIIAEGTAEEVVSHPEVMESYLGN